MSHLVTSIQYQSTASPLDFYFEPPDPPFDRHEVVQPGRPYVLERGPWDPVHPYDARDWTFQVVYVVAGQRGPILGSPFLVDTDHGPLSLLASAPRAMPE